jgi:hypothetical protein
MRTTESTATHTPLFGLVLLTLSGCALSPIDHEGKECPCGEGAVCVDAGGVGVCVAPFDAGPSFDAGIDGGPCPEDAAASCSGGDVCLAGRQARSVCSDGTLYTCGGEDLRTIACPNGCSDDGLGCAWTPAFLASFPEGGTQDVRLSAGTEPVWVLDTDRGEILRYADLTLSGDGTPDTSSGLAFDAVLRAFAAETIVVENGVTVLGRGSRPLVLYGRHSIVVSPLATISVSARGTTPGPAGSLGATVGGDGMPPGQGDGGGESCVVPSSSIHKTGGGGGGFGTEGGDGGRASGTYPASQGGAVWGSDLTVLRGGSGGGAGCVATVGGAGGGALYLLAGVEVVIEGDVVSGGGGGRGGAPGSGGAGGGSGGAIAIEAPRVEVSGRVAVGGGSGGQGSLDFVAGADGHDGSADEIPTRTDQITGAGGIGGDGSNVEGVAGAGSRGIETDSKGGGGGGGAGRVWVYRAEGTALTERVIPLVVLIEGPLAP